MDDSLGGMFKLTGSNYSVWKSKMRDMLVVKDLWLPVQFGDKIDAAIWEVMHMKTTAYIRCLIDMSLYNNFNEESKAHELWEKIGIMFQNKNAANQVSVFRKLVRLWYQDGSSMAEHMKAFQGLIHQTTALEVPLADEVLALFLLGSLPERWETLVVTLGTVGSDGKRLSLVRVKASLLDEEARRKEKDISSDSKALITESERGRPRNRSPQNREKSGSTCFKGVAYLLLLWKTGSLPKELSALPKGQGGRRLRFEAVNGPKQEGPKWTGPKGDDSNRGK